MSESESFSRTCHTFPICLSNFDFDQEGGGGSGEVKMLYPKWNWENYQILYSLKFSHAILGCAKKGPQFEYSRLISDKM